MIASALLGIGSTLLIDKLDNTYHSLEEIKQKLKLPLLGTIPLEKELQKPISKNERTIVGLSTPFRVKISPKSAAEWLSQEIP